MIDSMVYESSQQLARLLILRLKRIADVAENEQDAFSECGKRLYRLYRFASERYAESKGEPETEAARVSYAAQRLLATMLDGYSPQKQANGEFTFSAYCETEPFIDALERAYKEAMTAVVLGVSPMPKNIFGELQSKR